MIDVVLTHMFGQPHPIARIVGAMVTALLIGALSGSGIIAWLKRKNLGERTEKTPIEDEALRKEIEKKSGTPTMGGLIILCALLPACLLWGRLDSVYLWLALGCFVALAGLGMVDDWLKLTGRNHTDRGLKARHKLLVQGLIGAAFGAVYWLRLGTFKPWGVPVPLLRDWAVLLGPAIIVWSALVVATLSSAVNLTDGMDGLAGGLTVAALLPLAVLAYGPWDPLPEGAVLRSADMAVSELAVFCAALGGAVLGFLWYNAHPAKVFMGDTGSLAIGGSIGLVAVAARADLLLPVIGFVFLAEFGSSVLQILWFKATGRRILPIAPLHYIWQKRGMPEQRIVARFWIVGLACALLPLAIVWHGSAGAARAAEDEVHTYGDYDQTVTELWGP